MAPYTVGTYSNRNYLSGLSATGNIHPFAPRRVCVFSGKAPAQGRPCRSPRDRLPAPRSQIRQAPLRASFIVQPSAVPYFPLPISYFLLLPASQPCPVAVILIPQGRRRIQVFCPALSFVIPFAHHEPLTTYHCLLTAHAMGESLSALWA
jgi:hypothetical protein